MANFVANPDKGILGTPDPEALWSPIIDQIPDSVLLRKGVKILNVAFGHCTEADILVKRMKALGRTREDIKEAIVMVDQFTAFCTIARRKGYTNIHRCDFTEWEPGMKFDLVIGNPPYKAGMHLDFLKLGMQHLKDDGSLVFVHPAEWLVQKRDTPKSRKYKALRDELAANHRIDITFIDNPWGDDAMLFVPLTVTKVSNGNGVSFEDTRTIGYRSMKLKPKSRQELDSIEDVTMFGNPKHVMSILDKVWAHEERWKDKPGVNNGKFFLNLARLAGDGFTDLTYLDGVHRKMFNMYSLVNSIGCTITNEPGVAAARGGKAVGNERIWVSFKTKQEAQNALDFLSKTKFFRAFIATIKIDQHAADTLLRFVPWLDWKIQWTDETLNEFFGFSEDEVATINEIVEAIVVK